MIKKWSILVISGVLLAASLSATTITGMVYNTGAAGAAEGTNDAHWTVTPSGGSTTAAVVRSAFTNVAQGYPVWLANDSNSKWVSTTTGDVVAAGDYTFAQAFTLDASYILSTLVLHLQVSSDNTFTVKLNGVDKYSSAGVCNAGSAPWCYAQLWPSNSTTLDITGFTQVANTLSVVINNVVGAGNNPMGARVVLSADATLNGQVPEPATYALIGLGLAGVAFLRRRR